MRSGEIAADENVPEVRLHYDANGVILAEAAHLPFEPLAGADGSGDEILQGLSLHRHGILMTIDSVKVELEDMGHQIRKETDAYGGYQGIWRLDNPLCYFGGSDPRKDGCAIGY